jgi:hypothetical protein
MHAKLRIVSMGAVCAALYTGLLWILDIVRLLLFEMQSSASATGSVCVLRWKVETILTELRLAEGAVMRVRNSAGFIDRK